MEETPNDKEQRDVAERVPSRADGWPGRLVMEDYPLEPEIVKSDRGIEAIRVPVIVSPNKNIRNIKDKTMEQDEPSSSSRAKRQVSASFSFRANSPHKLSRVENCMDGKPLDLSVKSTPSTVETYRIISEKQHEFGKNDIQTLPSNRDLNIEAEFSSPEENTAKKSENEIRVPFHSYKVIKINESLESQDSIRSHTNVKRKMSEDISTNTEADRCKSYNSASSRKIPRLLADSDHNEIATYDFMSSRPSTSSGEGCSYDTSVNQDPSTCQNYVSTLICKQCSRGFSHSSALKKHMRIHTDRKPFKCKYCQKTFKQKCNFKRHIIRFHTNLGPYSCKICRMAFPFECDLKRHFRSHTGEKPYKCEICEKAFSRSDNLKTHKNSHKGKSNEI